MAETAFSPEPLGYDPVVRAAGQAAVIYTELVPRSQMADRLAADNIETLAYNGLHQAWKELLEDNPLAKPELLELWDIFSRARIGLTYGSPALVRLRNELFKEFAPAELTTRVFLTDWGLRIASGPSIDASYTRDPEPALDYIAEALAVSRPFTARAIGRLTIHRAMLGVLYPLPGKASTVEPIPLHKHRPPQQRRQAARKPRREPPYYQPPLDGLPLPIQHDAC